MADEPDEPSSERGGVSACVKSFGPSRSASASRPSTCWVTVDGKKSVKLRVN